MSSISNNNPYNEVVETVSIQTTSVSPENTVWQERHTQILHHFNEIIEHASITEDDIIECKKRLKDFCGENGDVKFNLWRDKFKEEYYQICLYFETESERNEAEQYISAYFTGCKIYDMSCSFEEWQEREEDSKQALQLSTNQTLVFIGADPWERFIDNRSVGHMTKLLQRFMNDD